MPYLIGKHPHKLSVLFSLLIIIIVGYYFIPKILQIPVGIKGDQITIEGRVEPGYELTSTAVNDFIGPINGTYYLLIDNTDKAQREKHKDPTYCPSEGTIFCYIGKNVKVSGIVTKEHRRIGIYSTRQEIDAKYLYVKSFDVVK